MTYINACEEYYCLHPDVGMVALDVWSSLVLGRGISRWWSDVDTGGKKHTKLFGITEAPTKGWKMHSY